MFDDLLKDAKDFFIRLVIQIVSPFIVDYIKDFILKKTI